jgi:hypothetical protein
VRDWEIEGIARWALHTQSPISLNLPISNPESTAKIGFLFKMARRSREKLGFSTPKHLFAVESIFNPQSSIFYPEAHP